MRGSVLFIIIISFFISNCTTGVKLKKNDFNQLFHGGNSRIWMVSSIVFNGIDYALKNEKKIFFSFDDKGSCYYQTYDDQQKNVSKSAKYEISDFGKKIKIEFKKKNEIWNFDIKSKSIDKIELISNKKSDVQMSLTLIPFPELR